MSLIRAILCELFAGDYEILEADNGKTAVDLMEQYHEEIAIVLMDIVMPIMDGLEALEIMNGKGLTEKTPIFLITAESSNDAISKGFRLGVVDVVLNRSTQIIFASALIISSNCTVIVINWKSWSRNR